MSRSHADDSSQFTTQRATDAATPSKNPDAPPSDTQRVTVDGVLPADSRVGKYVIRRLIGRGGMGCVYAAWDEDLRRTVAVKVMHPKLADDGEHRLRFLREARAVAALSHDNVVSIFEVQQSGELVFFAMPYLTGMTLGRFLVDRGPPPLASAVRIAREIASGLAAAHAVGLLHRDIKPGNVFLEAPRGRAKLLDFGLVSRAAGDAALTQPGLVVGTPAYMSPEQARGKPLDVRSDLFSLGAVLYHMTAGRMPFEGPDSVAILAALMGPPPKPVGQLNAQVPPRLERLIQRMLSKEVGGRPDTTPEVVDELRAIERELSAGGTNPVLVPPATPIPGPPANDNTPAPKRRSRSRRSRQNHTPGGVVIALVLVSVLLALVGGALLAALFLLPNFTPANATPTTAPPATATDTSQQRPWEPPPHFGPPPPPPLGPDGRPLHPPPPRAGPDGRPPPPPPPRGGPGGGPPLDRPMGPPPPG